MPTQSSFDYTIIRVVPRVERGEFLNVGVVLFCRVHRFLGSRIEPDWQRLAVLAPDLEREAVQQHLATIPCICAGGPAAGPIGQLPPSERFHWLVAPRSTIIQTSPVHCGLCSNPEAALEHLLTVMVRYPPRNPPR